MKHESRGTAVATCMVIIAATLLIIVGALAARLLFGL
jgi:hypothetical protein